MTANDYSYDTLSMKTTKNQKLRQTYKIASPIKVTETFKTLLSTGQQFVTVTIENDSAKRLTIEKVEFSLSNPNPDIVV